MKLLVKGDDLGWTEGVNYGIEKCARDGLLTMTGCMANMPAAKHGIELLKKYDHISIGQHTNLVVGKPCADRALIPHLIDENGNFHSSRYYRQKQKECDEVMPYYDEIMIETEAQLNHLIDMLGRKPDYIEGHAIASNVPEQVYADLAEKYGIKYLGNRDYTAYDFHYFGVAPYVHDLVANPKTFDQFTFDVTSYIMKNIEDWLKEETTLLLMHPGFVDADIMNQSSFTGIRMRETEALCSEELKQWVKEKQITLINCNQLEVKHVF